MMQSLFYTENNHLHFSHLRYSNTENYKILTHTHEFPELLYITEVSGSHITEDKKYTLKSGDLILTPPAVSHRMEFDASMPYERYCIVFDTSVLGDIDIEKIYENITVINCDKHSMISDIFKKADYYHKILPENDFQNMLDLLIKEIFYNLSVYDGNQGYVPSVISPILSRAINYINENLYEINSVSDVSNALFIAESYLFKIFKEQLKTTPKKYITSKKLHLARKSILLGAKPTDIYFSAGYTEYSAFYKSYVKFFSHAPGKEKDYGFNADKL